MMSSNVQTRSPFTQPDTFSHSLAEERIPSLAILLMTDDELVKFINEGLTKEELDRLDREAMDRMISAIISRITAVRWQLPGVVKIIV